MAKHSPFQALVDRQLDSEPTAPHIDAHSASAVNRVPDQSMSQPGSQVVDRSSDQSLSSRSRGKSSSPDYQRLTVYLRRDTILDLKRRIAGTNVELSDIVHDAVDRWFQQQLIEETRQASR